VISSRQNGDAAETEFRERHSMASAPMTAGEVAASAAHVHVRLLEGFDLTIDGHSCALPPSAQRLVAFLALQHQPVVRSRAAGTLWSDHSEQRAAACLRSAIWRCNSGQSVPVVEAGRSRLRLHEDVTVDVRTAAAAAHEQLAGAGVAVPPSVLAGELLPGWYDDWVLVERERMRQLCLQAMERMAASLLLAGQLDLAIEAALTVVVAEPLRESAHRILVDAYVAAGNRAEALRQYDWCCTLLRAELDLPPGDALVAAAARAHGPASVTSAARQMLTRVPMPAGVVLGSDSGLTTF
jgi:DNA-binding SARP family transcriptional activator